MYILFDIGGTKIKLASSDGKSVLKTVILDTPKNFEEGIQLFKKTALELAGVETIEKVAGGIAGPLDKEKSTLLRAPHLPGWVDRPLRQKLAEALNAPVFLENDSALVALGEATQGAGKGFNIVAYLTISTGVGGARIVGGKIDDNSSGFEPGHQIIDPGNALCRTCENGELESYVSGAAFEKRFGKKPYDVTDSEIWEEMARFLALGLHNSIVHWSPDVVVLGGSMMKEIGIPIDRVKYHLEKTLNIFPVLPKIKKADLGDLGGLYGALEYLRGKM